ncbi:MAG TPA: ribosome-associated translation inhibitor RaiA [Solirubrobacterales bacterium]|nr:ribosome-associated translation inhibitor RaiA [Solirubrobacterales bacterium]
MRIQVRGHNTAVTDAIRQHVEERFTARLGKQVSDLAQLHVDLMEEHREQIAEATLQLKGTTLRAREGSGDLMHSIDLVADKLARQVKRHREKRRGRRDGSSIRGAAPQEPGPEPA